MLVRNFQLVDADEPTVPNDPHAEQKCNCSSALVGDAHLDVKHPAVPPEALRSARSRRSCDHLRSPLCGETVPCVAATAGWRKRCIAAGKTLGC